MVFIFRIYISRMEDGGAKGEVPRSPDPGCEFGACQDRQCGAGATDVDTEIEQAAGAFCLSK